MKFGASIAILLTVLSFACLNVPEIYIPPAVQTSYDATVQLEISFPVGEATASGFHIGNGLFLTAKHAIIFKKFQFTEPIWPTKVKLRSLDGINRLWYGGEVLYVSATRDLAMILCPALKDLPVIPLVKNRESVIGMPLYVIGTVDEYKMLHKSYVNSASQDIMEMNKIVYNGPLYYGYSGGPIINPEGELVGMNISVIVQGNNNKSHQLNNIAGGTPVLEIISFIEDLKDHIIQPK